jgi:hypothetical protein
MPDKRRTRAPRRRAKDGFPLRFVKRLITFDFQQAGLRRGTIKSSQMPPGRALTIPQSCGAGIGTIAAAICEASHVIRPD